MRIFGREVTMWVALICAAFAVASGLWFGWSTEQNGVINAIVVAAGGLVVALFVKGNVVLPAVVGFAQAVFDVALAFNVDISPEDQSVVLAFVATAVGFFVRQQVTAPVQAVKGDEYSPING